MSSYCSEKLQGEVYQSQLVPHCPFYPGPLWGELGTSSPRETLGLFIQRVPLFLLLEMLKSFVVFCFSRGQSVFLCSSSLQQVLAPSPIVAYLSSYLPLGIQCHCQKLGASSCIFFLLLFPVEYF